MGYKQYFNNEDVERFEKIAECLNDDDKIYIEPVEVENMDFKKDILYDTEEFFSFLIATNGFIGAGLFALISILKFLHSFV